uniref:Beta-catenin-like protein 1 N-terminal domain-containing protein n=1 Tax=Hemiselmis andersenii TaxID=464988 RepID=A0A6U2FPL1_HEMAN
MEEDDGGDDDYEEEETEEDRAAQLDRMLEEAEPVEVMDLPQLKRLLTALDRKVMKNQEMRVRHSDDPTKFMESEVELFEELTKLQALATAPDLYAEFVRLGGVNKVTELMDHDNVDVALAAVEVVHELTDPTVLEEGDPEGMQAIVDGLADNAALELLVRFLARLDETQDDGRQGVYNILEVFENLSELQPGALEAVCDKTDLIDWLFKRLKVKGFDQNKLYSSEVLSILCQSSEKTQAKVGEGEGMDRLLGLVAPWKKKDPPGEEEAELIQNIFNVICSALMVPANQSALVEGEGIELMVIIMQNRRFAARCALRVLDYAMNRNTAACERFVSAMGLKTLFPAFMRPSSLCLSKSKEAKQGQKEDEEHIVSIVSSLLLRLGGESHARVLNKFMENGLEKVDRLMELHEKYHKRAKEAANDVEDDEEDGLTPEERRYMARLDRGLFSLQHIDVTIAFLLTEEIEEVDARVRLIMRQNGTDLAEVLETIEEYHRNMGDEADRNKAQSDVVDMKEVLKDLEAFLNYVSKE